MTLNPIKIIKNAFKRRIQFFLQMVNILNNGIVEIKTNGKERSKKYISLFNKKEDILYLILGIIFGAFISFLSPSSFYKYISYSLLFFLFYIFKRVKNRDIKEVILGCLKMLVGILISSFFYSIYISIKGTLL